ncbi:hypothetical protein [Dyella japonica]|uniref:Histidinol phosphatase-like PHP family hydrolase n=1 Tax=Dyella japonica TaxID=231455 RepID=A0ABV2K1F9_9GAMM
MRAKVFSKFLYVIAAVATWTLPGYCLAFQQKVISGNGDLYLSEEQVDELQKAALDGDAQAATRLLSYYGYYRSDYANAEKWAVVAAENGGVLEQCNAATILKTSDSQEARKRAGFWLKKCRAP